MTAAEPFWLGAYGPGRSGPPRVRGYHAGRPVRHHRSRHGDRPAYDFFGRSTTYTSFDASVRRVAASLQDLGVGPGDRVVLMMPNSPSISSPSRPSSAWERSWPNTIRCTRPANWPTRSRITRRGWRSSGMPPYRWWSGCGRRVRWTHRRRRPHQRVAAHETARPAASLSPRHGRPGAKLTTPAPDAIAVLFAHLGLAAARLPSPARGRTTWRSCSTRRAPPGPPKGCP
jgi:acyl-CoA synthetase (AMP-forming)/AMP-acid ligase II